MERINALVKLKTINLNKKYISFDLFDTIIRRKYINVFEVHDAVSAYALSLVGLREDETPGNLTLTRYNTCNFQKVNPRNPMQEPTLHEIWSAIVSARVEDLSRVKPIVERIVDFERTLETANLEAVSGAIETLAYLKQQGKTLIAISDMYFGEEVIRSILRKCGLEDFFSHVFVSAEENLTKQTGDLFKHACATVGIQPGELMHVGDNLTSDITMAQSVGITAVHIDQASEIAIRKPEFGVRQNIHAEIADTVKLYLFNLFFKAVNEGTDHIYFMGRDGCMFTRALEKWNSPLIKAFFGHIPHSDIFITRATSCWGNINFSGEWLEQAFGNVFLLRGGKGSPKEISTLLGIEEVPSALEDRVYRADLETAVVVAAYRDAGLSERIKKAIIKKRELLGRYLRDIGFFNHRKVAMCDVGYSGSVPRDLNLYLLQEGSGAGELPPPKVTLHLLATNSYFENNRQAAKPHVEFSETAIIPAALLPETLLGSMAWLEVFFKHPTLGPVKRLVEKDGRVEPEFTDLRGTERPQVSQAVLDALEQRESDVILLFMAAQRFWWPQFIGPMIDRFSNPDAALLAQLEGNNYEDDAAIGGFRPILHIAPESSPQEIERICRQKDCWVSGSIEASKAARMAAECDGQNASPSSKPAKPSKFLDRLIKGLGPAIPDDFDADFYRDHNPDLRVFTNDRDLWQHYRKHGRREGRAPSAAAMLARLEKAHGALPPDFHPAIYLQVNPDLQAHLTSETQALEHYCRHGRAEGRRYRARYDELEAELEQLIGDGRLTLSEAEKLLQTQGKGLLDIVLARADLIAGSWVELIQPTEFSALNAHWCGTLSTRASCIVALVDHGLKGAPPLSLDTLFDPVFYRRAFPALKTTEVDELYRHWLNVGNNSGKAPSEAFALKRLTGRHDFPEAFDWEGYARTLPRPFRDKHPARYDILVEFLNTPGLERLGFVRGPTAAYFTTFLGHRAMAAGRHDEAIAIFERAIQLGAPAGQLMHLIGDLMYSAGRHTPALDSYVAAAHSENPNRWSYINAANVALERGDILTAVQMADRGKVAWKRAKPWRRIHTASYNRWIDSRLVAIEDQARKDRVSPFSAARIFVHQCAKRIEEDTPTHTSLANPQGPLAILTGRPLSRRAPALLETSQISLHSTADDGFAQFERSLVGASQVIFHEVGLTEETLRLVLVARGLGLKPIFWAGDLSTYGRYSLADIVWSDQSDASRHLGATPRPQDLLIGLFCDEVITTSAGFVPVLQHALDNKPVTLNRAPEVSILPPSVSTRKIMLVRKDSGVPDFESKAFIRALAERMAQHPSLHVALDTAFGKVSALYAYASRIRHVELEASLTNASSLIREVDGVIQIGCEGAPSFAYWADAVVNRRSALLVISRPDAQVSPEAGRQTDASPEDRVLTTPTSALGTALDDFIITLGQPADAEERALAFTRSLAAAPQDEPPATPLHRKPKVLLVNVFTPPQVSGGAARVLKDNLDFYLDHHRNDFEFALFSADDENEVRGECPVDSYRGVPIMRIATPQENDMYWRGFNPEISMRFAQALDAFKPDLVHIHCLQLLTVAVAEQCAEKGIPYIVTLHDEWWLSDYHFLIDDIGSPRPALSDLYAQPHSSRIGFERSIARGRRLRNALAKAQRRMAVSEACAQIYRDCGFDCDVVENGVSRIVVSPRTQERDGKVRLCHVGGFEYHKGAYLLQTALMQGSFTNLTLTIVDLARQPGDVSHTMWGTTPVEIIGRVPHQMMGKFYSQMDVLITPSTCPETYGLATREALAHGLWVIASDRGANGDAVSSQNGFVVDVSTPQGLISALLEIDANAGRYLNSPPSSMPMRTVNDQSRELIEIYRGMINLVT